MGAIQLSDVELRWACEAIGKFKDKAYTDNIPIYGFWAQTQREGVWEQQPTNIIKPLNFTEDILEAVSIEVLQRTEI